MKLIAEVKHVAVRGIHQICTGYSPTDEATLKDLPDPTRAEIEISDDGTCMMYRYGVDNVFCGDTWHETLVGAKRQGAVEYDIAENDWK